jgi:hypothetical protein
MSLKMMLFVLTSLFFACSPKENSEMGRVQNGELQYQTPAEWVAETPASSMRHAQFRLPGADGVAAAELALFHFPGSGGSTEANLSRWYRQFSQPDGSDTAAKAERKQVKVNGLPVTLVYVTGIYHQSSMGMGQTTPELTGYAMLAAIVETSRGPWFFKATGPQVTIDHWRPAFEKFVETFKLVEKQAI